VFGNMKGVCGNAIKCSIDCVRYLAVDDAVVQFCLKSTWRVKTCKISLAVIASLPSKKGSRGNCGDMDGGAADVLVERAPCQLKYRGRILSDYP